MDRSPVESGQLRCRYCCLDGVPFLLSFAVELDHVLDLLFMLLHLLCVYEAGPYKL